MWEGGEGEKLMLKTIRGALSITETRASQNVSMAVPIHISFLRSCNDYVVAVHCGTNVDITSFTRPSMCKIEWGTWV